MSSFQFALVIDSAAHPELYAALSTIDSELFRAERLRQLASSGLIWETLRAASTAAKATPLDLSNVPVLREIVEEPLELEPNVSPDKGPAPFPLDLPTVVLVRHRDFDVAEDLSPAVQMSGTRARMLRMQRRGLFNNE